MPTARPELIRVGDDVWMTQAEIDGLVERVRQLDEDRAERPSRPWREVMREVMDDTEDFPTTRDEQ